MAIIIPSKSIYDIHHDKVSKNAINCVEKSYNQINTEFGNVLEKEYHFRFWNFDTNVDIPSNIALYENPNYTEGFIFVRDSYSDNFLQLRAILTLPIEKITNFTYAINDNGEEIITSHRIKSNRKITDEGKTFTDYVELYTPVVAKRFEDGKITISYKPMVAVNGIYIVEETISLVGNYIVPEEITSTIGEGDSVISIPSNELIQDKNTNLNKYAREILTEYANGKETAKILCSIGEYYDENSDLLISTKTADKMTFEHYDKVVPMIRNGYGQDEAMSYNADGTAKVFEVVGVRVYSDGAVWQELTLREVSEGVDIPTAEKLATPQISISQDLLTIFDNSGKAEQFEILVDGTVYRVISSKQKTFDLSSLNLDYGSYKITVIAIANDYINSTQSNAVSYTVVAPNIQTLPTPYITLEGDTLYIYGDIANAEKFDVWVNGSVKTTTTSATVNLSSLNLGVGTFTIFVVAKAKGYNDSTQSDSVTYVIEKKTLLLAGKYVFNKTPDLSKTINQPLNTRIIVGSTTYTITNISIGMGGIAYTTVEGNRIVVYDGSTWASDNLRNIELLENAEVTTSFYEWFFQSVTKQKISFTIGEKSYTADAGMSWYQWCNSSYNVDKWLVKANTATEQVYRYTSSTTIEAVYDENVKVSAIDKIVQGTVYVTREEFSQESSSAEILEYVDENFAKKGEVSNLQKWVEAQEYTNDKEVREIISTEVAQKIENKDLVNEEQVNSIVGKAIESIEIEKYVTADSFKQTLSGYTNTQDMRSEISKSVGELSASVSQTTQSLQNQIVGAISTWYYEGVPTTSNAPAVNWETDKEKQEHDGDLYYDQITGYAYRWQRSTTGYYWQKISDTDINKALEEAEKAKNMQIGGRNLAWYTDEVNSPIYHLGVTINDGKKALSHRWNLTKSAAYYGTSINSAIFTAGETYTISYFICKTAGTLLNIGGHASAFAQTRLSIDGKETSSHYANGVLINNDTSVHYIVFTAKYIGGTDDNRFYIQPNRGYDNSITYDLWNIKVEKGEKATDWTPAWEEYYTTVDTDAKIKVVDDKITSSVGAISKTLADDYLTIADTKSLITQTAEGIRGEVTATVDKIQIGGRNILSKELLGSQREDIYRNSVSGFGYVSHLGYPLVFGQSLPLGLKRNQGYTISFKAWCATSYSICWDLWVHPNDGDEGKLPQEWFTVTNQPTTFKFSFICDVDFISLAELRFINVNDQGITNNLADYIYITDIKIEEGNKATDWTPAVADMASVDYVKGSLALEIKRDGDVLYSELSADVDRIDFKSGQITITSDNFTLDKEGKVSAKALNILGGDFDLTNKRGNRVTMGTGFEDIAIETADFKAGKTGSRLVMSPSYLSYSDNDLKSSTIPIEFGVLGNTFRHKLNGNWHIGDWRILANTTIPVSQSEQKTEDAIASLDKVVTVMNGTEATQSVWLTPTGIYVKAVISNYSIYNNVTWFDLLNLIHN